MAIGSARAQLSRPAVAEAVRALTALSFGFSFGFVLLCYSINGLDAFRPQGHLKNSLFALGGVYGQALGTLQVIRHTVLATLIGICSLAFCDYVYARHTKARWFGLHIIANFWISVLCLPGVWLMLYDPLYALREGRTNHWPTSLVFAVHVYHMLFFKGLHWIDWLHHILMVVVGAPMLVTAEVGPLMNFNNFFMCGLPGGADYAMLFAVKHGWMTPIKEKKYNCMINVWFRAPFLVAVATLAYLQFFLQVHPQQQSRRQGLHVVLAQGSIRTCEACSHKGG